MDQRETFNSILNDIIKTKSKNNVYLNKRSYQQMLRDVGNAKLKIHSKTPVDYRRLQRYDILREGETDKLIYPVGDGSKETNVKYFLATEELFDAIHSAHLTIGHGGRTRLVKKLATKYKNVTTEAIMLYLSLCKFCQGKSKVKRKMVEVKPNIPITSQYQVHTQTQQKSNKINELNTIGHVNVIDMQIQPDNEYKFILYYQDHLTKYVVLRPLQLNTACQVAEHLIDIFTLFGAPAILQCEQDGDFINQIYTEISNVWDSINIVNEIPQTREPKENANQDIEETLSEWMATNNTTKWSHGLKFIQMTMNCTYHQDINLSPYEALFGKKMKYNKLITKVKFKEVPDEIKMTSAISRSLGNTDCRIYV